MLWEFEEGKQIWDGVEGFGEIIKHSGHEDI
jgi:hypothetical protein